MGCILLKVEVILGNDIRDAFDQATLLASRLGITVEFSFNGVTCLAIPYGYPEKGVEQYQEAIKNDKKYPYASNK